jgi:hypothetical protein
MFEVCRTPPLLKPHETAIMDSGCTGHFLLVNAPFLNKVKSQTPLTVRLPNGATVESPHTAELNTPLHPKRMFSPEWSTILYFHSDNYAMKDTQLLSRTPQSQLAIPGSFKF